MKKWLFSICMILVLAACKDEKKTTHTDIKPIVKIGAILPLSGPQASMGEAAKAGMIKALNEKDKSSLHYNYKIVFEDNQAKLPSMPAIANKLIMQDKIDAIGVITSAMAKAIAPVTDQNEKLLYSFSIEEKNYERFGKYAFVQGISTEMIAEKLVELFMANHLDNVAIFIENIGVLGSMTNYLEQKLSKADIKYDVSTFNPGEREFRIALENAKNKGYTNFYEVAFPPERDILFKQSIEAGIINKNIYTFSLDSGNPLDIYEGMTTISYGQGTNKFMEEIREQFNIDCTYGSAEFYDYVNITIDAYENLYKEGQKPTASEITAYIHNRKEFPCMSGNCIVNHNGFILNQPIVRIYYDGNWQTVEN